MVGIDILERALRWALERGEQVHRVFEERTASVDELRGAFARDALCIDPMLASEGGAGLDDARGTYGSDVPWFARRFVDARRERAMLRVFTGERLAACTADAGAHAFADCMRGRSAATVPSVVVRMLEVRAPDLSEMLALQREVLGPR